MKLYKNVALIFAGVLFCNCTGVKLEVTSKHNINPILPNIDLDDLLDIYDNDMDGDGILNEDDETPLGLATDDIIDIWTFDQTSTEFEIEWGTWNPSALGAGDYSAIICMEASDGEGLCPTEFSFSKK